MAKVWILVLGYILSMGQFAYSADNSCLELVDIDGNKLLALLSETEGNTLLQFNFDDRIVCTFQERELSLDELAASDFAIHTALAELVVRATVDDLETWLRIDIDFDGELLLDRETGEVLGLTDAEFLGDNSQLEASDFFVEYVNSLKIGGMTMRDVETNVPLLGVPYDHYSGRELRSGKSSVEAEVLSSGSIGTELLERVLIIFDISKRKLYMADA